MESRAILRVPLRWNDRTLLEDEPLCSYFATRSVVSEGRGRKGGVDWDKDIAEEVKRAPGGLEAAQAWLDIAFYKSEEEPAEIQNAQIKTTSENLQVFVKVFWLIYQNDGRAALILLNRERKERGYWWDLDGGFRKTKPRKSGPTKRRPSTLSFDAVSEATASHDEGDASVPSLDADADTASACASSVFDQISDEEKGDISVSSDVSMVEPVKPGLGQSKEDEENPARKLQDVDDQTTRSELASDIRGQKRRATMEEMFDEDMVFSKPAKDSLRSSSFSSPPAGESLISALNSESKVSTHAKVRASNPSESLTSSQTASGANLEQHFPHRSSTTKAPAPRKKSRPVDHTGSNSQDIGASTTPNELRRATRSMTTRETKLKQAAVRSSTQPNNRKPGRQSARPTKKVNARATRSDTARAASGRPDEDQPKRSYVRRDGSQKPATRTNHTSKSARRSTRESTLPARPQKQRRTGADEGMHIAMSTLTPALKGSDLSKRGQGTTKTEPSPAHKDVVETSGKLEKARVHNDSVKEESPSIAQTSGITFGAERPQASFQDSTVLTAVLGKRKEKTDDSQNQASLSSSSTVELQDTTSRPVAKLPARHKSRSLQRQTAPLPHQPIYVGYPLRHPDMKIMDEGLRDAVANALLLLNDPPKPLVDWTKEVDDQDLDDIHEQHFDIDPGNDSSDIATIRNHEPDSRPRLRMNPPMWAQSRQEVCESFDWFRSYQGGVYFVNDIVKGYLLSAFASSRDLFHHDGRLIISHGGGKSESLHSRDGRLETQMAEDQLAQDKSVRALMKNYTENRPLVLLADDRYKLFPYNLAATGCTYVVLGFYCVTHAWAESHSASNERGRVVRYKFSFQWCESQGEPWWIKQSGVDAALRDGVDTMGQLSTAATMVDRPVIVVPQSRPPPVKISAVVPADQMPIEQPEIHSKCQRCRTQVPQVYDQGWMCLTPECSAFWTMEHGGPPRGVLDYTSNFLQLKPIQRLPSNLPEIFPKPPPTEAWDDITTAYAFTKGWHCRRCGRLSSRYKWAHWECANCGNRVTTSGRLRRPNEFWTQLDQCTNHRIGCDSGILKPSSQLYEIGGARGEYIMYILPDDRGRIHLIRGNPRANLEADDIFEQYQRQAASGALPFRRFPLRAHKCRGTLLTNYFSQNSGEPYQYVGGTDNTVPFEAAASAVRGALELIRTRAQAALKQKPEFNEILSAAYMERQKMAFHSDSEPGLGPVVASLSLGSAAVMHFRLHARFRQEGQARENALTLTLRHGDVLVMEGAAVQECYEHTVIPCNFRIAATARWIGGA